MRHRRKTKKLTLFDQIILRFIKFEALYSVNNYNKILPVLFVIIIIIIIIIIVISTNEIQKITMQQQ